MFLAAKQKWAENPAGKGRFLTCKKKKKQQQQNCSQRD